MVKKQNNIRIMNRTNGKLWLVAGLLILGMLTVEAGNVNEREALAKAQAFMSGKTTRSRTVSQKLTRVHLKLDVESAIEATNDAPLYVFNREGGGFVIVSGDDRTAEVLGFSASGAVDGSRLPDNMKGWLESYVRAIERIPAYRAATRTTRVAKTEISPKLTTKWDQGDPYNLHAPTLHLELNGKTKDIHAVTGCVATSMAQLMNYYKYPAATQKEVGSFSGVTDVPVRDGDTGETDTLKVNWTTEVIPANSTIDWSNMQDTYDTNSTMEQKEAVARLMQYCGTAVHMNYGLESGASPDSMVYAYYDTFGYKDVYLMFNFEYTDDEWVDMIHHELTEAGPVMFAGQEPNDGGAHQFLIDGYKYQDDQHYFYVNWGWSGEGDGYYLLSVMGTEDMVDDTGKQVGYTEMQHMAAGLGPNGKGATSIPKVLACEVLQLGASKNVFTRASKDDAFNVDYKMYFSNYNFPHQLFIPILAVFKDNEIVEALLLSREAGVEISLLNSYGGMTESDDDLLPIGDGLGDGTYQIMAICTVPGSDKYYVARWGEKNVVTMTINGNKATFGNPTTAIESPKVATTKVDAPWYTLAGVRLSNKPTAKGVYIRNGKKMIVR